MARGEIDRQDDGHRRLPVKEQAPATERQFGPKRLLPPEPASRQSAFGQNFALISTTSRPQTTLHRTGQFLESCQSAFKILKADCHLGSSCARALPSRILAPKRA